MKVSSDSSNSSKGEDQTIHWEKAKGNKDSNIKYCSKEDVYRIKGFQVLRKVKTLKYSQLYKWELIILDIIKEEPDDRTIHWFRGKSGNNGKTSFCKYLAVLHEAIILGGKSADMKQGIISYKMNNMDNDPRLILVNLPKSFSKEYLSYTGIEECKDMLFYSGKYEGGQVAGNCPHLIIFSNEWPDTEKISTDRWKLYDIETEQWVGFENIDDFE